MKAKDLLKLPIEDRRTIMEHQCTPEIIHHYEVTCPDCGLYYGGHATGGDDICTCHEKPAPVFKNCNVCGRELIRADELAIGMCAICANEEMGAKKLEFYNAQFEWKVQDFWIGAFWKRTGSTVDLWLCFLPCLPLHISWGWKHSNQ